MYDSQELRQLALLFKTLHVQNSEETAVRLLKRFSTVRHLLDCPFSSLSSPNGLSESQARFLTLIPELVRLRQSEQYPQGTLMDRLNAVEDYVRTCYIGIQCERLLLLCLDQDYCLIRSEYLTDGSLHETEMSSRHLLATVTDTDAKAVIFCHNHPAGLKQFSVKDLESTRSVMELLRDVNVPLVDHLLYAKGSVFSLRRTSFFPEQAWAETGSLIIPRARWFSAVPVPVSDPF